MGETEMVAMRRFLFYQAAKVERERAATQLAAAEVAGHYDEERGRYLPTPDPVILAAARARLAAARSTCLAAEDQFLETMFRVGP